MSFLHRLLGKTPSQASLADPFREVLDRKAECLTDGSPLNNHKRCFAILVPISLFAYSKGRPIPELAKFTSDACLFELACYTLFSTDIWAARNSPKTRGTVQPILSNQISHLCQQSGLLGETEAVALMNSRIEAYGSVANHNPTAEALHFRLRQALHTASGIRTPNRVSMDKVSLEDPFADLNLTRELVEWDLKRMPLMDTLLKAVEV